MDEVKNITKAELIISEGKAYHFLDENCVETLIVKKAGEEFQIENKLFPLNKIMKHPQRNRFLNDIGLSWLHHEIAYPQLFVTKEIFTDIQTKKIADALSLSHHLIQKYNLHQYIDAKAFLELVLSNIQIDTKERLSAACHLIKVNASTSNSADLKPYIQEIISNTKRANLIGNYADAGIKVDLTKSTYELEKEWSNVHVIYEGDIALPEHFFLCKSKEDLKKLDCNDWFVQKSTTSDSMNCKKTFYIGYISDEKLLFEVTPLQDSDWFTFFCRSGQTGKEYNTEIVALGFALSQKNNQEFFRNNYHNTNPLILNETMSISGLLDSVI